MCVHQQLVFLFRQKGETGPHAWRALCKIDSRALVDSTEQRFITSVQYHELVWKSWILCILFAIGKELNEATIPHDVICVWIIQHLAGIVVNVFHGTTMEHRLSLV